MNKKYLTYLKNYQKAEEQLARKGMTMAVSPMTEIQYEVAQAAYVNEQKEMGRKSWNAPRDIVQTQKFQYSEKWYKNIQQIAERHGTEVTLTDLKRMGKDVFGKLQIQDFDEEGNQIWSSFGELVGIYGHDFFYIS